MYNRIVAQDIIEFEEVFFTLFLFILCVLNKNSMTENSILNKYTEKNLELNSDKSLTPQPKPKD